MPKVFPHFAVVLVAALAGCSAAEEDASPVDENPTDVAPLLVGTTPAVLYARNATRVAPMRLAPDGSFVESSVADWNGVNGGSAIFAFNVAQPIQIDIALRIQAFKPNYNELFVQIDGGPKQLKRFDPTNQVETETFGRVNLAAGAHRIVVHARTQFTRVHAINLTPVRTDGPILTSQHFSTREGRIYDPSGKVFQPRGLDVDDVAIAEQDVDAITKTWNANIIRLSPYNAKDGVPTYDAAQLGRVVAAYTSRRVVVELGDGLRGRWGDTMEGKELADHAAYYRRMALQFKDNPYVWFASPNEQGSNDVRPGSEEDGVWLNEEVTIARAIRDTGAKNLLVQGDVNWGQGATAGAASAVLRHAKTILGFGNVVAGFHVYNNRPDAYAVLSKAIADLRAAGFAVVGDEIGHMNGPTIVTQAGADAVLRAVEEQGIGMLGFRWYDLGAHAISQNGRGKGPLTPWGRQIWAMTH